jgi:hypothetical protein
MRRLELVKAFAVALLVGAAGCDGGPEDGEDAGRDAGMTSNTDAGPRDAGGSSSDAGMDAGGGGSSCGPTDGPCDISDPTSCGGGMACVLTGSSTEGFTTLCITAGSGTDGSPCTPGTQGQCAEGFSCSQDELVCRAWCCDDTACEPGDLCNHFAGAGPDEDSTVGLCVTPDSCDLVAQSGCEADEACNVLNSDLGVLICDDCSQPGQCEALAGASCSTRNGCVEGYGCYSVTASGGTCVRYCSTTTTDPCVSEGAGFTCAPLGMPAGVGICVPPGT